RRDSGWSSPRRGVLRPEAQRPRERAVATVRALADSCRSAANGLEHGLAQQIRRQQTLREDGVVERQGVEAWTQGALRGGAKLEQLRVPVEIGGRLSRQPEREPVDLFGRERGRQPHFLLQELAC